jgi:acetoin utilization deacetylase AcuC-like enzyme
MQAFYSDHFVLPLPAGHRFPMQKYRLLRDRVAAELPEVELCEAPPALDEQLMLAHAPDYVRAVALGHLGPDQLRAIGFPWSQAMVERSRRSAGATLAACYAALHDGVAVNLAGGTHHAAAAGGAGFCVFNDVAVAARTLQRKSGGLQVAVIDLDVHQGDGTAAIFADDPTVFTLSLHGERNYPFTKARSDLDVGLPDGCDDETYLDALERALATLFKRSTPGLLIYLAGADPHRDDRLGRLALTLSGLARRDRMVFDAARTRALPIAVTMAGGYGRDIADTVEAHLQTVRLACAHARQPDAWIGRAGR